MLHRSHLSPFFNYISVLFVTFAFLLTSNQSATAGPILGHLDASVIEVTNPCGVIAAPSPWLGASVPTLSDHVFAVEAAFMPAGNARPISARIEEDEVYQFDGGVAITPGSARVIYD